MIRFLTFMDGSGRTGARTGLGTWTLTLALVVVACATAGLLARARVAQGRSPARAGVAAAPRPTVRLANTMVGTLLVNHARYTVFMFTREKHGRAVCTRIRRCLTDWPAVTTIGRPVAGPGVKRSLLGTIAFRGRLRQVTYAGHPLHTYRFDYGEASMMAIGNRQFGGSWYALKASGQIVK